MNKACISFILFPLIFLGCHPSEAVLSDCTLASIATELSFQSDTCIAQEALDIDNLNGFWFSHLTTTWTKSSAVNYILCNTETLSSINVSDLQINTANNFAINLKLISLVAGNAYLKDCSTRKCSVVNVQFSYIYI